MKYVLISLSLFMPLKNTPSLNKKKHEQVHQESLGNLIKLIIAFPIFLRHMILLMYNKK